MADLTSDEEFPRRWCHRPIHLFRPDTLYCVTAATWQKLPIFRSPARLDDLTNTLLETFTTCSWEIQAWAVFANHYHVIAAAPAAECRLRAVIRRIHSLTARAANATDRTPGRRVWFQYWDTCLTYERSWLARLNYVNQNPVRHQLVEDAHDYRWCSARWFAEAADSSLRNKVASFRIDRVNIVDDF